MQQAVPEAEGAARERESGMRAGGSTGAVHAASAGSSGASWWARRRSIRNLKSSGASSGYVVIQGYGLTETAPVATLNHPFETQKGTVGKAIAGVEIRIAPDGEVLLRGENVTPGYYGETDSGHSGCGRLAAHGRYRRTGCGRSACGFWAARRK